mgnify:CR=1 FL=1
MFCITISVPFLWSVVLLEKYRVRSTKDLLDDLNEQFEIYLNSKRITKQNLYESLLQIENSRLQRGNIQLEHFYNGISSVLPTELFCLFQPRELENLICGSSDIDLDLLKSIY